MLITNYYSFANFRFHFQIFIFVISAFYILLRFYFYLQKNPIIRNILKMIKMQKKKKKSGRIKLTKKTKKKKKFSLKK